MDLHTGQDQQTCPTAGRCVVAASQSKPWPPGYQPVHLSTHPPPFFLKNVGYPSTRELRSPHPRTNHGTTYRHFMSRRATTTTCLKQLSGNPVGAAGFAWVQLVDSPQYVSKLDSQTQTFHNTRRVQSAPQSSAEPTTTRYSVLPTDLQCQWSL